MRHEYDTLIRDIADLTNRDFYWVKRMLARIAEVAMEDKITELEAKINLLEKQLHASILGEK